MMQNKPVEKAQNNCDDLQERLNTYAENLSLNAAGVETKRYLIPLKNRGIFPELDKYSTTDVMRLLTRLNISQIILPNDKIISSIGTFEDGFAIKGTDYQKFLSEYPEDAIRVD